MGLDIGYFNEIQYLERPDGLTKEFFEALSLDSDYVACHGDGSAVIFANTEDLLNETEFEEVKSWITENIKPIADADGYCRLYLDW